MFFIRITKKLERYIIAVDFDGTLCSKAFPEIGPIGWIHRRVENYVKKAHAAGAIICLWTCRMDHPGGRKYLQEAIDNCKERGIPLDYINDSPNSPGFEDWHPRKIYADEYIDDLSKHPFCFLSSIFSHISLKRIKKLIV